MADLPGQTETTRPRPVSLLGALALAEQYRSAGRLGEAETLCNEVIQVNATDANALHLRGVIVHQTGRSAEAIEDLRKAVAAAPRVALFHSNLGEMLRLAGQTEAAVAENRRAVALDPNSPEVFSNLGAALYDLKEYQQAATCHRRAIALRPNFALAHCNLGNVLYALKRYEKAIASYRQAIALNPQYGDAWSNLGTTLQHAGQFDEAVATLRHAITIAPRNANAHSGLGILLLMRGEFAEGLAEYEWRLQSTGAKIPRFPQRPWKGEDLSGRSIYVQAEQGFGDTIQFARYLPQLKARARSVSFRVQQPLVSLLKESLPGIEVLGDDEAPWITPDCECALMSLPHLFQTRLEFIPAAVPYLKPPASTAARWREQLGGMSGLKVAVVWAGQSEHANDFRRSLDLSALLPIFKASGASFASLQVGDHVSDLRRCRAFNVMDLSPKLTDFAETAGAMAALDLLITVDTSVAHLAGALGKPVWLLLPWVTDWRWLIGREDNPWYPTMHLYRQQRGEAWPEIIKRVLGDLKAVVTGDRKLQSVVTASRRHPT